MLAKEVGVGEASIEAMLERAATEEDYVQDQFRVLKAEPKEAMRLLFSVALSDKQLEDKEVEVLRRLAQKLDVADEEFDRLLAEAREIADR